MAPQHRKGAYHRAVDPSRWRRTDPAPGRKDGDDVPQVAAMNAAGRLAWRQIGGKHPREEMIVVPILRRTGVGDPGEGAAARLVPIGRQNRLPNHEHLKAPRRNAAKIPFKCGGPPQTNRSGRRKQKDHPGGLRSTVDLRLKALQGNRRQRLQRRLARGNVPRSPLAPGQPGHNQGRDKNAGRFASPQLLLLSAGQPSGNNLRKQQQRHDHGGGNPENQSAEPSPAASAAPA